MVNEEIARLAGEEKIIQNGFVRKFMLNPFGSHNDAGSYFNLQKRILERVQSSGINEQIVESIRRAYEDAIRAENVVLSGPERRRLFSQISKLILKDVDKKLDG